MNVRTERNFFSFSIKSSNICSYFSLQNCEEHDHGADVGPGPGVRLRDAGGMRVRTGDLGQCDCVCRQTTQAKTASLRHDQHACGGTRVI